MDTKRTMAHLEREEGRVAHAYRDSLGYLTIGVGHLIDQRRGGKLSNRIIDLILEEDIENCLAAAKRFPWWEGLSDARQYVVLGMIFQLGENGFRGFKNMIAAIRRADYVAAAEAMLDSKWATQDTPERARRMMKMMATGEWGR